MEKLKAHLATSRMTAREFANRAPMSVSFLSELISDDPNKRKKPSFEMAVKIEAASGGEVSVGDWPHLAAIANAVNSKSEQKKRAAQ